MKIRVYDAAVCRPAESGTYLTIDKAGNPDMNHYSTKHGKWGAYDFQNPDEVRGDMYEAGGAHEVKAWAVVSGKTILNSLGMEVQE